MLVMVVVIIQCILRYCNNNLQNRNYKIHCRACRHIRHWTMNWCRNRIAACSRLDSNHIRHCCMIRHKCCHHSALVNITIIINKHKNCTQLQSTYNVKNNKLKMYSMAMATYHSRCFTTVANNTNVLITIKYYTWSWWQWNFWFSFNIFSSNWICKFTWLILRLFTFGDINFELHHQSNHTDYAD